MLKESEKKFDLNLFEKKLQHYFSDSAPCEVSFELGLSSIKVNREFPDVIRSVEIPLDENKSIPSMIHEVVLSCEDSLYPRFLKETSIETEFSPEEKQSMIAAGVPPIEALSRRKITKTKERFCLCRVSMNSNHLVIRSLATGKKYLCYLKYIPVKIFLERYVLVDRDPRLLYDLLSDSSDITLMIGESNEEV